MSGSPKLNWLRWVGVLPCSILAYLLAYALIKLFNWFQTLFGVDKDDAAWFNNIAGPAFASGMAGYVFVVVGTYLAPMYKKNTGLILMILLALLSGVGIFAAIINKHYVTSIIESVAQLVGAVVAYKEIEKKENGY